MKANEMPEKIYLTPLECMAAGYQPKEDNTIEYIRADAFIEKACLLLLMAICTLRKRQNRLKLVM